MESLRELANVIKIPIIASGGVSSLTDLLSLLALESLGVTWRDRLVGLFILEMLNLKEAIQAVGNGRWQDVPPNTDFLYICYKI